MPLAGNAFPCNQPRGMDLVSQKRNKHRGSLRHTTPGRKTGLRSSAINHALKQIHSRLSHVTVYKTEWSKVAELLKLFIPTGGLRVTSDHSSLCFTGASITWLYKQNSAAKQQCAQSSGLAPLPSLFYLGESECSQSHRATSPQAEAVPPTQEQQRRPQLHALCDHPAAPIRVHFCKAV